MSRPSLGTPWLVAGCIVFGCLSLIPVEMLSKRDRGCGDVISLAEYAFSAVANLGMARQPRRMSWWTHLSLVACAASYSLSSNVALGLLPMPVFLTLKNGSLLANLVVGLARGKRYARLQVAGVCMLTLGLVVTTVGAAADEAGDVRGWAAGELCTPEFACGILAMGVALLSRAMGGTCQEIAFERYGPQISEVIFWRSVLALPVFLLRGPTIGRHVRAWAALGPVMPALLAADVSFDYTTRRCVSSLIAVSSSLTASVTLSIQRLISVVISAAINSPPAPPPSLWAGSACVLLGTCMWTAASNWRVDPAPVAPSGATDAARGGRPKKD